MKLRSLLLAAAVGLASTFAFAQAPALNPADTTSLQQAIAAKDAKAIAQLAKNNPAQAQAIARAAALGAPDQAAVIAAAVAAAAGPKNAAGIAKAVAAALPGQAATIAAAVAKTVGNSSLTADVTRAVVETVPAQAASVAVAVITVVGPRSGSLPAILSAAIEGIPSGSRSDGAVRLTAAVLKVPGITAINTLLAAARATFGVTSVGVEDFDAFRNLVRGADATAVNNAFSAGSTAAQAGSTAGLAGLAAGSRLVAGNVAVVNSPPSYNNNGNVDAGQIVSGSGS